MNGIERADLLPREGHLFVDPWGGRAGHKEFWKAKVRRDLFPCLTDTVADLWCGDGEVSRGMPVKHLHLVDPSGGRPDIIRNTAACFLGGCPDRSLDKVLFGQPFPPRENCDAGVFDLLAEKVADGGRLMIAEFYPNQDFLLSEGAVERNKAHFDDSSWCSEMLAARGFLAASMKFLLQVNVTKDRYQNLVWEGDGSNTTPHEEPGVGCDLEPMRDLSVCTDTVVVTLGFNLKRVIDGAYPKESVVHGIGLFSSRPVNKGEVIGREDGSLSVYPGVPTGTFEERIGVGGGVIWKPERRTTFSLINHSREPNVKVRQTNGRLEIVAEREIRVGEEIFLDYRVVMPDGYPGDYL